MLHTQKTPSILLEAQTGLDDIESAAQMEKVRMGCSTQGLSTALEKGLKRRAGTSFGELSHRILFLALNRDMALLRHGKEEVCPLLGEELVRVGIEIFSTADRFLAYTQACSAMDGAMVENNYQQAIEAVTLAMPELKWYFKRIAKSWLHLNVVLKHCATERREKATQLGTWDQQPQEEALEAGRCIQLIRTALLWWKRLPLCLPPKEESFKGFLRTERRLAKIDALYGEYRLESEQIRERPELKRLLEVMRFVGHTIAPDEELMYYEQALLGYVPTGANADAARGDYTMKFWRLLTEQVRNSSQIPINWKLPGWATILGQTTTSPAKVVCVPKAFGKQRVIAEQPVTEQVIQNVIASYLDHQILCVGGRLEHICDRADQTRNREIAKVASFSKSHDTIDLTEASDSQAWSLTKITFSPRLVRYMSICRSQRAKVDKRVIRLHKAFTSGASLCFPSECYLFITICLATWLIVTDEQSLRDEDWEARASDALKRILGETSPKSFVITVFGDDIVCPSWLTSDLVRNLRALGFRVNMAKSYTGLSPFRESCGIEAFEGVEITPLRFPRNFESLLEAPKPDDDGKFRLKQSEKQAKAQFLQSIRTLHNSLYIRGYVETYTILRSLMKSAGWGPWMVFSDTSEGWLECFPSNQHLPTKECNKRNCANWDCCPKVHKNTRVVQYTNSFGLHRHQRPEDRLLELYKRSFSTVAHLYVQLRLMAAERCKPSPSLSHLPCNDHPLLGRPHHYVLTHLSEDCDGWHYKVVAGAAPSLGDKYLPRERLYEVDPQTETQFGRLVYSILTNPFGCE